MGLFVGEVFIWVINGKLEFFSGFLVKFFGEVDNVGKIILLFFLLRVDKVLYDCDNKFFERVVCNEFEFVLIFCEDLDKFWFVWVELVGLRSGKDLDLCLCFSMCKL